ncbi:transaldolase [Myxococcaceae bacterium JPH2]|nr:transaldolase [Myxococcaceae bacterium JPH2]
MLATQILREMGQSLWLDNITRGLLDEGTLARYAEAYGISGLTSNPSIFDLAIRQGNAYDAAILEQRDQGRTGEAAFFPLALEDLTRAAELFRPIHEATGGRDGWVSLEVSPLLAYDSARTVEQAVRLHALAGLPNLFIKIPGTPQGMRAIEDATFAGVPINVTLLFSAKQYLAAADAYRLGIERRIAAGRSPDVPSVASLFISRWDRAVEKKVTPALRNRLGIAMAGRVYRAYTALRESESMRRLVNKGGRMQQLLWASTGTKDPAARDTLYVEALAAPFTINTLPEPTLKAFAEHGRVGQPMPRDGGDAEAVLAAFAADGVDVDALADQLQREGAEAFVASWDRLMECIAQKMDALPSHLDTGAPA